MALALGVLAVALTAPASQAGEYEVWSCTKHLSSYSKYQESGWDNNYGSFYNFCPTGLAFQTGDQLNQQYYEMMWRWSELPTDSRVKKVTLTMAGGDTRDGLVYSVLSDDESVEEDLPARTPTDGPLTTTVEFDEPVQGLRIRAQCRSATCSGTSTLYVSQIQARLVDDRNPYAVLATTPTLAYQEPRPSPSATPWTKEIAMKVVASGFDSGSGVASMAYRLDDGSPVQAAVPFCYPLTELLDFAPPAFPYEHAGVCEGYKLGSELLSIDGLSEGMHRIRYDVVDAVGNVADPTIGWFGIDRTPPQAPTSVEPTQQYPNEHGWMNQPYYAVYTPWVASDGPDNAPLTGGRASIQRDDIVDAPTFPSGADGVERRFPSEGHFRIDTYYLDAAGNKGASRPYFLGFDTTPPPAPVLEDVPWLSRKDLVDDESVKWDHIEPPSSVESKICGFATSFDQDLINSLPARTDVDGNVNAAPIPPNLREGRNFAHVATVSCADNVSETSTTSVNVDETPPSLTLTGLDPGTWLQRNQELRIEADDQLSGVESLEVRLDGEIQPVTGSVADVEIGNGKHLLSFVATDVAGNVSTTESIPVWVDASSPTSWITQVSGVPNGFVAHVVDPLSGVQSAALQYRRIDAGASSAERIWRQIGGAYLASGSLNSEHSFTRVLDDGALADGKYELRVYSVDVAENDADDGAQPLEGQITVDVPLRARPVLTLAIADLVKRCSSSQRTGCATSSTCRKRAKCTFSWVPTERGASIDRIVDYAKRTALIGSVLDVQGKAIAGMPVKIFSTTRGGSREFVADATSDASGRFTWKIGAGASRDFEVVSAASNQFAPAVANATMTVRAGLSMSISDRTPRAGQTVRITGRLASGGLGVPPGGKRISFQVWRDGKWKAASIEPTDTDGAGEYAVRWTINPATTAGLLRFRAIADSLPTETDWPFAAGKSPSIPVRFHTR